ncbi:hypothetical protein [Embleya sp. NPDC059237]|uniref:hypothetical protein n=1 Tax=Embleya sp. NPDC059237 TaxID=3346784 RepID=UPI00368D2FE7
MANPQPFKVGDLVEATVAGTPPRTVRLRPDRDPWPSSQAGTIVVCDATSATVVHADSVRRIPNDGGTTGAAARPPDTAKQSAADESRRGHERAHRSER